MLQFLKGKKITLQEGPDSKWTAYELGVAEAVRAYKIVLPVVMVLMALTSIAWELGLTEDKGTPFGGAYLAGYLFLLIASAIILAIICKYDGDVRKNVFLLNELQMTFSWMLLIWSGAVATLDALEASPTFNGMLFMACEFLVLSASFMKPRRWVTIQIVSCGIMLNAFRIMPMEGKLPHMTIFVGFAFASVFGGMSLLRAKWENYQRQEELSRNLSAVEYDELTGLYTRQAFAHRAKRILEEHPDERYDLLVSDIEGFKLVNQRYGENVGDAVLKHTGDFLKPVQGKDVIIGRYDGDRFVCLMKYSDAFSNEENLVRTIAGIAKDGPVPTVVTKFGIYDDVPHDQPISELCDCAVVALRTIKHQYGRLFAKYDGIMQGEQLRIQQLEEDMLAAEEEGQFRVFYQPKHNVSTGGLIGAEALIRWEHPSYGFMSPAEFIPLFERSGFISSADRYVWEETCRNLRSWKERGLETVPISVNLSKKDFENDSLETEYKSLAAAAGIPAQLLHLEVTESLFSDREEELCQTLEGFRKDGFLVELDDFGSGYSSLNLLGRLPLDCIKFDMSFMRAIHDERRLKVYNLCVQMAKSLGLTTLSEGVETEEQLNVLRGANCDAVQGYYYSRPLPAEEFEQYLERYSQKARQETDKG